MIGRSGKVIHEVVADAAASSSRIASTTTDGLAAFEAAGLDIADYANADIAADAPLPWDHIDVGVSKEFLAREDAKADQGEITPDCRSGDVLRLWSADAAATRLRVQRVTGRRRRRAPSVRASHWRHAELATRNSRHAQCLFTFRKGPEAQWLGHLDLMRVFERAVRMSGIDVAYTQGFNPRAKMSIASALPLGATADASC